MWRQDGAWQSSQQTSRLLKQHSAPPPPFRAKHTRSDRQLAAAARPPGPSPSASRAAPSPPWRASRRWARRRPTRRRSPWSRASRRGSRSCPSNCFFSRLFPKPVAYSRPGSIIPRVAHFGASVAHPAQQHSAEVEMTAPSRRRGPFGLSRRGRLATAAAPPPHRKDLPVISFGMSMPM